MSPSRTGLRIGLRARQLLIRFIIAPIYHHREQFEHAEFLKIIETNVAEKSRKEEVEKMGKTMAQVLIEEGKEIGRETGIVVSKQEDLVELLSVRFAPFPQALIDKIKLINEIEQLKELFHIAVVGETADEVIAKLTGILNESW